MSKLRHRWESGNRCARCGLERLQQGRYHSAVYGAGVFFLYREEGGAWKRGAPRCFNPKQAELFSGQRFESQVADKSAAYGVTQSKTANTSRIQEWTKNRVSSEHCPSHQGSEENLNEQHPLLRISHPIAINEQFSVHFMFDPHSKWFGVKRVEFEEEKKAPYSLLQQRSSR